MPLQVIIYQGASELTVIEEKVQYSLSQLIATIGSNMNAFTGLSFLVIFEFVDVLVAWIAFIKDQEEVEGG